MSALLCGTRKHSSERGHDGDVDSNLSQHSSIRGVHKGIEDRHFAKYCPISETGSANSIYSMAFMPSGNGWAPREIGGGGSISQKHMEMGVTVGDVGILEDGRFSYLFNIFYPKNDSIQPAEMPRNFNPIEPPLSEWEMSTSTAALLPGTIIAGEGVQVEQISESPRRISFTSYARAGGVMILPTGASREDLVDPQKLYPYLKEHAVDWYQFLNLYSGSENFLRMPAGMNGTLLVVTGSDRVKSCATAVFPVNPRDVGLVHSFQYDESHGDYCWSAERMTARTFAGFDFSTPCSVFIRGISIALGEPLWKRNLPLVPPKEVPIYEVYAKPLFEPQDSYGRILEWAKGLDRLPSPSRPTIMFHPSMILLQLMIDTAPSVDVAFVDDCIWRPLVGSHHLTHPRLVEFMKRVLEQYDLSVVEGVATLVKRPEEQNAPDIRPALSLGSVLRTVSFVRKSAEPEPFRTRAPRTLSKILHRPFFR
ncbi:hypothetical protein NLJ89_g4483 [Agrocybe chaxingu]|uniref:Uncharacterized protein n=1 Tax=Agrocybe chaxingu TaxID=84603 RepID=A0A9W8K9N5_9AGAR|nr:hypothetical protein NLJ89_g4483 [Agrocybe chaxingu]